jgi:hypothetical protein
MLRIIAPVRLFAFFLFLAAIGFFSNCNGKRQRIITEVSEWDAKTLYFPKARISLINFKHADSVNYGKKHARIVTAIDGSCSSCIQDLTNWKAFMQKAHQVNPHITLDAYVSSGSFPFFEEMNEKDIHYYAPLIYDLDNQFAARNKLPEDNKMYKAFLVDGDDKVILVGNPALSKAVSALYLNKIKELVNR